MSKAQCSCGAPAVYKSARVYETPEGLECSLVCKAGHVFTRPVGRTAGPQGGEKNG